MRRTLTLLTAVLAFGAMAPGIAQATSDPALCKSGGYVNYIDPATSAPFKNQGQCVSFVDGGGTLLPVQEEPPAPAPIRQHGPWSFQYEGAGTEPACRVDGTFFGEPGATYPVTFYDSSGAVLTSYERTAGSYDGSFTAGLVGPPLGTSITAVVGGQTFTTPTLWCVRAEDSLAPDGAGYTRTVTVFTGLPNSDHRWVWEIKPNGGTATQQQVDFRTDNDGVATVTIVQPFDTDLTGYFDGSPAFGPSYASRR
jgi:hypothetical protein